MYIYPILCVLLMSIFSKEPELPNHIIPLYGNASLGYYYANIYVGTPPQQQSVIVDTGSGQLALPCSKCQNCGPTHIHPPFKLSQSHTSKILTCNSNQQSCQNSCGAKSDSQACTFAISYAEGSSLSGIIIQDQIQFEGDTQGESIKTTFGCTTKETNLFYTQAANGIFGLAPMRQSKLFEKLNAKHSPKTGQQLIFSLCLSKNGGQLIVGKLRNEMHRDAESVKTTYSRGQNLYSLDGVGQIKLGEKIIKSKNEFIGSFGVFIDSGATFTYLPRSNYNHLSVALQNACAAHPNQCLVGKSKQNCFKIQIQNSTILQTVNKIFPPFEVHINNKIVLWGPADYFILKSRRNKQVCIGIQPLDRFILGGNWMVNKDIAFNLKQATVQIFSNSKCQIQKTYRNKLLHQKSEQLKLIQSKQVKMQSESHQQMVEYTGGMNEQQISYMNAIFREENNIAIYLVILLIIIGGIIILLVMFNKLLSKKQQRKQLKQEEHQSIANIGKIEKHMSKTDDMQNEFKNEEVHTEDIIVSQVQ